MSLRLAVATQQGFDETMADAVDHYESSSLAERHKVALRVADAMMSQPGSISAQLRSQVREHFSEQEILELTLDVMKWNYQKVAVALGIDAEVTPGQLTDLHFDSSGRPNAASGTRGTG
jgi:hypothetical protein